MVRGFDFLTRFLFSFVSLSLVSADAGLQPSHRPSGREGSKAVRSLRLVISTERKKYSLQDSVELDVALRNVGDASVYIDRRMEWGGYGAGLKLDIRDEQGRNVPDSLLNDAIMPPPAKDDPWPLVRLDEGRLYGAWVNLPIEKLFHSPGKYSIRVVYKSWLRKEYLEPRLRKLPVIWWDDPPVVSDPIWIEVVP